MQVARVVHRAAVAGLVLTAALATGTAAHADTLYFANGRMMAVKACRVEGSIMTVTLRGGGEATFDTSLIARVAPSEVPEPEDATAAEPVAVAMAAAAPTPALDIAPHGPRPYASLIATVAGKHGVPVGLVHAVIQAESNYQPRARSAAGARGLMQVMPRTGAELGVRNLYDPTRKRRTTSGAYSRTFPCGHRPPTTV
jgi:membrane-bound lytic murein transglycosylase B